ncbi:extracellular solute-binding protein [Halobellus rarus]|uniref:Extracellular solute-binding protein n=1 Tax=Halobellus rarus TaxID=1126237 RepID=A0ABD6CRT2_9EURY|nr:extracellular solute-binding protein [Halobellus rarus]
MVKSDQTSERVSSKNRRRFLQKAGAAGVTLIGTSLAGCSGGGGNGDGGGTAGDSGGSSSGVLDASEPADKINWISQDYASSQAIKDLIPEFEEETGITVETTFLPFNNYQEKFTQDLRSGAGQYDVAHSDPYQIASTYYPNLQPLGPLANDPEIKDIPNGLDDFQDVHVVGAGRFGSDQELYTLPFDCPTLMLVYRKDIIDQYKDQAESDLGFPFEPGKERTYEEYKQMGEWMNENVDEVEAGIGHQAAQHDALQCDFHQYFWANGGTSFEWDGGSYSGTLENLRNHPASENVTPSYSTNTDLATSYKEIIEVAHPGSTSWDWNDLNSAFANGEVAMCPQWTVFNPVLQNPDNSEVAGKIEWSLAPSGSERSGNLWGGTGLGINGAISDSRKLAAWKFITWATSPDVQRRAVMNGGGAPTRASVYEMDEIVAEREKPGTESQTPTIVPPVLEAWKPENTLQRPHLAGWPELNNAVYSNVNSALTGGQSMSDALSAVDEDWSGTLS